MTIDKIKVEKLQYQQNQQRLSDEYEYLAGYKILPPDQSKKQAMFT